MRHYLTLISPGHTTRCCTLLAIVDVPMSTFKLQGRPEIKSSHSTPNSMDGLQAPRGVPATPDKHLLGLQRRDQRPGASQRVSDILWRRCMHIRTAFNGTHTAVLSEDQLGSTPDGSALVTLHLWHAL